MSAAATTSSQAHTPASRHTQSQAHRPPAMTKPSAPVGMVGHDPVSLFSFNFPAAPTTTLKAQQAQAQAQVEAHVPSPPSPRTRTANKSERRRSLPLAPLAATAEEDAVQLKKSSKASSRQDRHRHRQQQSDLSASASARPLYERRRNAGAMSPTLKVNTVNTVNTGNTARSIQSDRTSLRTTTTSDSFSVSRLRSNSGLSLHTNSAALRRYIDYNADGSSRLSPTHERERFVADLDSRTLDDRGSDAPSSSQSSGGLFSWDTVRAVLDHPRARDRLWAYTRATGGTENLEFLQKVEAYAQALHGVTALMATISTRFTCVTATEPLKLPPHLAKALNTDVKHVSSSILPGLEMLFADVDAHIKDRVLRHIYPAFTKHQLGLRMKASLGASSAAAADSPFKFAGLGRAFCLTDPYRADNPIVYASDSFAHLLGYDCAEQIPRTGRFFRGPEPTQSEKNQEQFTEDLVLSRNHRDNRPFWSLVSACPLKNASGRVRFNLYGLVDVTDAVKSTGDIVHALSVQPSSTAPVPPEAKPDNCDDRRRISVASTYDMPPPPAPPAPSSRSSKTSKSSFFNNPFSRRRKTAIAADDASSRASSRADKVSLAAGTDETSPSFGMPLTPLTPSTPGLPASPLLPAHLLATYSRFMVLQYVPGTNSDAAAYDPEAVLQRRASRYGAATTAATPQAPQTSSDSAGSVSRLKVAFSSIPMLELLGLGPAAQDAVMYHDVFAVLSELAGSPSITPVFRANVRQRIVTSESASLELSVPASSSGVPGLTGAPGALSAGLGAGLASPSTFLGASDDSGNGGSNPSRRSSLLLGSRRLSRQEDDDVSGGWTGRRRRSSERPPSASQNQKTQKTQKTREPKMQRLMSHWTPLKDVDGSVAWVILVMSPIVE